MPVLHPAPRSPIRSPLISQPRPSPYLRGVNFRAATGSRLVDIPAHSSHKPLPLSCIFTRPCCRLIHQQEIYTCMLDTHCGSTFYTALLFTLIFSFLFLFLSHSFGFHETPLFVRSCSRVSFYVFSSLIHPVFFVSFFSSLVELISFFSPPLRFKNFPHEIRPWRRIRSKSNAQRDDLNDDLTRNSAVFQMWKNVARPKYHFLWNDVFNDD